MNAMNRHLVLILAVAVTAASAVCARPYGPVFYGGRHGRYHGGFAAGVVGGAFVGGMIHNAIRPYRPVVYSPAPVVVQPAPVVVQPAPVVVQQPVVVQPAPVVVQQPVVIQPAPAVVQQPVVAPPAPESAAVSEPAVRTQRVWVEGCYVDQVRPDGSLVKVWQPGRYVTVPVSAQ